MGVLNRANAKHAKARGKAKRQQLTRMAWNLTMEKRLRDQVQAKRAERTAAQSSR
jgi:hypothetical protein